MCIFAEVVLDKWTELRTAYKLAKLKTLSATASDIGVHRSTVMRHVDVLEEALKVKLFQRNDKGYIATEAGLELMRLGEVTDNHFTQFSSQLSDSDQLLEGTIRLTFVSELSTLIMPTIVEYQQRHTKMCVEVMGDLRNFNLEYGEADLAIRGGPKPQTLDNIVLPLIDVEMVMCVHQSYIEQYGRPSLTSLNEHRFIALKERITHLPWNEWIHQNAKNIVIKSSNQQVLNEALFAGAGVGFTSKETVESSPVLQEITSDENWSISLWVLIHRDMINMPKIRKFLDLLQAKKDWSMNFLS